MGASRKSSPGRVIYPEGSSERGFFGNRKGTKRRRFAGRPTFGGRGPSSDRDNTERKPFDYSRIRNRKPPIDVSNRREERAKFERDRKKQ